jgi:hypothetical protein
MDETEARRQRIYGVLSVPNASIAGRALRSVAFANGTRHFFEFSVATMSAELDTIFAHRPIVKEVACQLTRFVFRVNLRSIVRHGTSFSMQRSRCDDRSKT